MLEELSILKHHGRQYIPNVADVDLPALFRGRPIISQEHNVPEEELVKICPTQAIVLNPLGVDLGKCVFCGECALAYPQKIKFTNDYKLATNDRKRLIVREGEQNPIEFNPELIRKEIVQYFSGSLKLRQVCAGSDNSCELELNACSNVNFDMGRFGVEFVASPRHADGLVITGPIVKNMAQPLQICYDAIPEPKLVILCGTEAISGGIFADSPVLAREFLSRYKVDLYIPGSPVHPLTFIYGILSLIRFKS